MSYCPACGTENIQGAYLCGTCGATLKSAFGAEDSPDTAAPVTPGAPPSPPAPFASHVIPAPPAIDPQTGALPSPYAPPAADAPPTAFAPPPYAPQAPQNVYPANYPYYGVPQDGNTSGMGEGFAPPPFTQGWTFAGCLPFGLFAFLNNSTLWGVLGLGGIIVSALQLVYAIYIGIEGRKLAWKNRRFESVQQYEDTMRAWNTWGLGCLAVQIILIVVFFAIYAAVIVGVIGSAMSQTGSTP